jgi:hypothetical protein
LKLSFDFVIIIQRCRTRSTFRRGDEKFDKLSFYISRRDFHTVAIK